MLSIRKTYFYIFCFAVLSLFTAPVLFKLSDELCLAAFALLAGADMVINRNYRKYRLLFVLLGVMTFYLIYSLLASPYNIPKAIVNDFIMQCKPLVAFAVSYAIAPSFTGKERKVLKVLCVVLSVLAFLSAAFGVYRPVLFHIYYVGLVCVGCVMVYLLLSYDREKPRGYSQIDLFWAIVILLLGLVCTRSKYYGFAVLCLYMLFVYRPGTINLKSFRNMAVALLGFGAVFLVGWNKIEYYFITGNTGAYDPDVLQSYARPALFLGAVLVLTDHLFLGSGLASFATFSSSTNLNYSEIYHEYGLSTVWGLMPEFDDFIADTFFPELAQFGLVGIFCFGFFCWWIWRKFRLVMRVEGYPLFAIGAICIAFLAIDGVAGCAVLQASGELLMAVMGIVAGTVRGIPKEVARKLLSQPIQNFYENKKTERYEYEF